MSWHLAPGTFCLVYLSNKDNVIKETRYEFSYKLFSMFDTRISLCYDNMCLGQMVMTLCRNVPINEGRKKMNTSST